MGETLFHLSHLEIRDVAYAVLPSLLGERWLARKGVATRQVQPIN